MLGERIGNFCVISLLGRGGMGEVYLAEHVGIQTRVAIKVLLPEISSDRDHVQRLFNEARLASRIKHAGIAKIFDVGFHEGRAYLVMELLEGESLARRIQRGSLSEAEVVEIAKQTANVLAATHAEGITHRDLKPDNIYLTPDAELACRERVKILDFGIAKLSGGSGPRTVGTMGTPDYMAPEQWGDSARVDWRADAYSLGCVMFEMVTGRPPFVTTTIADAYVHHTQSAAPSTRTCGSLIASELDTLIMRLLAKDPVARGASMAAIASQLGAIAQRIGRVDAHAMTSRPALGTRPPTTLGGSVGELAAMAPARGRTLATVIAGVAFACMVAVGVIATRGSDDAVPEPSAPRAAAPTTPSAPPPSSEPAAAPRTEPPP